MFCGSTPCACNKKPAKKAEPKLPAPAKRAAKVDEPVVQAVRPKPAAMPAPLGVKPQRPAPPSRAVEPEKSYKELLSNAVTALAEGGLLGEETIIEHEKIINLPFTVIEALKWRSRVRQKDL